MGRLRDLITSALSNTGIFVNRGPLRGYSVEREIGNAVGVNSIRTIFDVGANIGQSALNYAAYFPQARVWCFEPVPGTFATLMANTAKISERVTTRNFALGEENNYVPILLHTESERNKIMPREVDASKLDCISIRQCRLDDFCSESGIESIDFLKVDTEGHDLSVLRGATEMISRGSIKFIMIETGLNSQNDLHVPFSEFLEFFSDMPYQLFGIYEQTPENSSHTEFLRRANVAFMLTN